MTGTSETAPDRNHSDVWEGILARAAQIVGGLIIQGAILFLGAGRIDWTWGWVFLVIYVASISINSAFMIRSSPETIAERGRPKEIKNWDKVISGSWALVQFVVLPLVSGLDVRHGWSRELGAPWHLGGALVFAGGLGLSGWAMITNAFFSTAVRIQTERGHAVCRTGPYRLVRHPGYLGTILQSIAIPVLLGSWWALIPGIAAVVLMVIRTSLEDRTLQAELPGYREFIQEVRYRLIPGVW